jgi:transcriptional regulator of acetoin/glycerol metabolism
VQFFIDRILTFQQLKREYIRWILKRTRGNKSEAARLLGIDRSSFHRLLRQMKKVRTVELYDVIHPSPEDE